VKTISKKNSKKLYNPNLGFIGNVEVKVANYLFSAKKLRKAYQHAEPLAKQILEKDISSHYNESKKLTKFIKNRDLTFSKKTAKGYKTFTVPCTTTVVPLQKSIFNEVERAAQKLIISCRKVLQDLYSSKDIASSEFVKSLPSDVRKIFIEACETSPSYFPQLHHKNMKDYPFMDNVGLDLVLVEDYVQQSQDFPKLIVKNNENNLPALPFRILELNAGSPSGASNNMNMLDGLYSQNPEILESLGKIMPNDHFKVLGETYKSLGEDWTGIKDGVQVILPPGGSNGAAPEIHQLAAYSGLIYADTDQLYADKKGFIRLRTVCKSNPIVTAAYSRINSDSALFDPKKGLTLRDPDSGEEIYLRDALKIGKDGKAEIVTDINGKPVPLESAYAIPNVINAIVNKKFYMGGLNRILDNKIILATLTHYAPKFYNDELTRLGVNNKVGAKLLPPQTLPPTKESVDIIKENPDEWVIKAPNLAGGQGVYIMKTLPSQKRREVLEMITKRPTEFAYQQLVKIGRIPVAVQRKDEGYRFANLAADIRIWVFYGAGKNALPKMTHNALVRYAPQEKGKMSSIVNTSAGGGYAPFVIVDDVNDKNAVTAKELVAQKRPNELQCELPVFVAAQVVQVSRILKEINAQLESEESTAYVVLGLLNSLKLQLKEILSFLHPRSIEYVYRSIDLIEAKIPKKEIKTYFNTVDKAQNRLVKYLTELEDKAYFFELRDQIDNLRIVNIEKTHTYYTENDKALDIVLLSELKEFILKNSRKGSSDRKVLNNLYTSLNAAVRTQFPATLLSNKGKKALRANLEAFCNIAKKRLSAANKSEEFAELLSLDANVTKLKFETLYLGEKDSDREIMVASQFEMRNNKLLVDTNFVSNDLKEARKEWMEVEANALSLDKIERAEYLNLKRAAHFKKYPKVARLQEIINSDKKDRESLIELLDAAPYAKFNILHFAQSQGLDLKDVFTSSFKKNRLSILNSEELKKQKLCNRDYAGECFAKKKESHGLYSYSDIFIWLREEVDPFTLIYTAGHELIHYQQIKNSMEAEKRAVKDGGVSLAKFLNYYGNFLGANNRSVDKLQYDLQVERKPLYGYADKSFSRTTIINELRRSIKTSDIKWEETLTKYGSLLGYMMPNSAATRVKALQEVLPALENAKNITFAKEIGLEINMDAAQAAMPASNETQVEQYRNIILSAVKTPTKDWEALRIIASHQYHGITFTRADREDLNLTLKPIITSVAVGQSYNQTQQ
jgi:uncharacterized circularly permuted ATP-grasp superfamily protein